MTDSKETFPPGDMMVMSSKLQSVKQTNSENMLNGREELPRDDLLRTEEQDFSTNTLKKITFPISPFKKKLKPRIASSYNSLNNGLVHLNLTRDQNGLSDISVYEKSLLKDRVVLNEMNGMGSMEVVGRTIYDGSTLKPPTDLSTKDTATTAIVNSRVASSNTLVDVESNSQMHSNIEEERRISYMNLLDLNRTRNVGLTDNCSNAYKTENHKFTAYPNPILCDVIINDNVSTQNVVLNREDGCLNSITSAKHKSVPVNNVCDDIDSTDNERTLRTDLLNVTIMDKKKKLVDRIKMNITKSSKPVAKENIDLSIVKEESPESDTSGSDDPEVEETESPIEPIEQVNIKMEPMNTFAFEDNLSNVMPTVGHFMALPALRQSAKPKAAMADNEGAVPDNDCVVVHKLVCLICKKTETVSAKKSSVQGNIFLCKTCGKLFDKGGEMSESLLSAAKCNILDVTCMRCNLTFASALEVDLHNKEVHKEDRSMDRSVGNLKRHVKPQYCSDCNMTFGETDEVCQHIKSRRHKCEYCHKLFSTNSDLKKHVNIHTNEKTYVCIYCTKAFNSRGNMVKHLETHKERKRSFQCEFCNKTFLKSDHLKVHVNTHTNEKLYECPYCKKTFNRKYCLQLHVNIHTLEKIYECHFCNKICMDPSTLRKHIGTHSDQRPFKCEFCDKTFKQKPHLTAHMKMHDIKQTFSCSYCDKVFFSKNTLRVHINTHTHEKTFLCVYCQKTFTSKSNLLTHINNKHTVDRTYNCSYCGKVFTDPSTVKKHENIHTNELTYQCAYCDKVFLRKTHLRSHINMHIKYKPYKCKLCDKSFAIKGYLKVHNNIHKGIKPFKCKRCSKAFTSKSNLILHTNSHTKERMFQCSYCRKNFTQKANLKGHIIRAHMEASTSPV